MTKTEQCAAMGITAMCGFVINPWAAIGAFGGCCFLMAMPWSQEAMLVSAAAAALSSVAFTSVYAAISDNGDLPRWLLSTIEAIKSWGRK